MSESRPYWSERQGRRPARAPLTLVQVRVLFVSLLQEIEMKGYLQESFGYTCVDRGFVPGVLGPAISDRMALLLGYEGLWPVTERSALGWSDDTLFDVVEFLYDHVSAGIEEDGYLHTFSDCGWHFDSYLKHPAQLEYSQRVNEILMRVGEGFELTSQGEVQRLTPPGFAPILDALPEALEASDVDLVSAAVRKFRARNSSDLDRREAVRMLADVLESIRSDVKEHMLGKDEGALFQLANRFWVRHNGSDQIRDYDHEAWGTWMFYLFLASIHLVEHLKRRPTGSATSTGRTYLSHSLELGGEGASS